MRREFSARLVREEMNRATRVLSKHPLPQGIQRFELETDEDQDGDPVMWVWLDGEDTSNWSALRREALSDFLAEVKRELHDTLEEYWPHFRMRTVSNLSQVSSP